MIVVFDSGIGGLSIYKEVKKLLPKENYLYFADQKYFPYGGKSAKFIKARTRQLVGGLVKKHNPKLIVLACNSATVSAIDYLREIYPQTPMVGVVPVIKTAGHETKNNNIGVLCTQKTARSAYQKNLIKKFAADKNVYVSTANNLVKQIETTTEHLIAEEAVKKLLNNNIDTLVLGCTHFPLIKKQIQKIAGKNVKVLDSGPAVARQVKRVLVANNALEGAKNKPNTTFYTTGNKAKFGIMVGRYIEK